MSLTRRSFLAAVGGAAAVSVPANAWARIASGAAASARPMAQATAASVGITSSRLADNLFLLTGAGTNVLAFKDGNGVVLVDGGLADRSAALLDTVSTLFSGARVHTLFNTHWHPEQTGSNETLGKSGATIIAHENTRLWLTTDVTWPWDGRKFKRLPKIAQPNKTFYTTGKLDTPKEGRQGVREDSLLRYGYIPDAPHTDGDLYVYFPEQNVLAVGDAVSGDGWPVVDYITGGWIGGMVGGVQRLMSLANEQTRIVAGRGPVLTLADLKTQLQMYATIYERLATLLNKGRGPSEAVAAKPTKEFDEKMGNPDEFVRRAFESLWAYLSPDA